MYSVFSRKEETLVHIVNKMQPYIEQIGNGIVSNKENLENPLEFTSKLLNFKNEIDNMIDVCFINDMKFQKARDQSFQTFMNNQSKTPHYMAIYIDNEFKKGFRTFS